ncbi:HD domain-containing protein [Nocardioides sp. GY 10127]|uniref:HD domain-containing protein n=1 Tax=Nocardioides sp. GY 10127 TaxID=2569762 RepID=UPI0010A75848|nr:HD domain-containing protein [Nocardioides sp. GY 10127]TIC86374.1 HD domain-containing protein [Nocardioides sp. GY 10127]
MSTWSVAECRALAEELLGDTGDRWLHVQGVARRAVDLGASETVIGASWLHDIGYGVPNAATGMHAIDGASYLDLHGAPREVVALVAHHSGAWVEAEERGLTGQLLAFDVPDQALLDQLTCADMTTGPQGASVDVDTRVREILDRYEPQHPVARAVERSQGALRAACARAIGVRVV